MTGLERLGRNAVVRMAAAAIFVFIFIPRACAELKSTPAAKSPAAPSKANGAHGDPWTRKPTFGFGASELMAEDRLPFAEEREDGLAPWKSLHPEKLPTEEGSIIYQDPMAGLRGGTTGVPSVSPWQKWLLPGGAAFVVSAVIAVGLIAWRVSLVRRSAGK